MFQSESPWLARQNVLAAAGTFRRMAALIMMLALASSPARAQSQQHTEHQMQAAVLGHLAKFVSWPPQASTGATISIGILGHDPFGTDLEAVLKEIKIQGKSFSVLRSDDLSDLLECQIIYFSSRETGRMEAARTLLQKKPILTVGEDRRFLGSGGMINFHLEKKRIRFAIDLKRAEAAGLLISAQLLRLATEVNQ